MSDRRTWTPSRVDVLWDEKEAPFDEPVEDPLRPCHQFVGGVYACQCIKRSSDGKYRTALDIVKLPSPNKGTDLAQWTIYDEKLDKYGPGEPAAWIYPDWDLLVILEVVGDDEDPVFASDYSPTHNTAQMEPEYYFHLRTLSTNAPHPDVCEPLLHLNYPIAQSYGRLQLQLQGPLMLAHFSKDIYVIWDWINGAVVSNHRITSIKYMNLLLWGSLLLATCPNSPKLDPRVNLPILEIYPLYPHSGSKVILVARMEVPHANWEVQERERVFASSYGILWTQT
ncbi:hypothetical protein B0J17DRAFT_773630 [Rhizoctonia solani]|nr:hypothetical protein B0J17DRAFT_773630 [Rhizoctonia solani]